VPSWAEFEAEAPEFAARVRERLDAYAHKTLATLRRDGSPRISGTEAKIEDGRLWIGSGPTALKALDLKRDPRFALHCGTGEDPGEDWPGDAKLAGVAVDVSRPDDGFSRFDLDLREVSTVRVSDDRKALVVDVWTPGEGVRTMKRA
jgi:Pyridoxamine 5'-phosphate oxidase